MRRLVLFLEEVSAKAAFEGLLPRLLPEGIPLCREKTGKWG